MHLSMQVTSASDAIQKSFCERVFMFSTWKNDRAENEEAAKPVAKKARSCQADLSGWLTSTTSADTPLEAYHERILEEKRAESFTCREWLFERLLNAREAPVTLLLGDPGAGKSAVMAELVQRDHGAKLADQEDTRKAQGERARTAFRNTAILAVPLALVAAPITDAAANNSGLVSEAKILQSLQESTRGDQWTEPWPAAATNANHCSWSSVACDALRTRERARICVDPQTAHAMRRRSRADGARTSTRCVGQPRAVLACLAMAVQLCCATCPPCTDHTGDDVQAYGGGYSGIGSCAKWGQQGKCKDVAVAKACPKTCGHCPPLDYCQSARYIKEHAILHELYMDTNGSGWLNSAGWLDETVSHCQWHGVDCSFGNQSVTEM
jgi:hypothetical protein